MPANLPTPDTTTDLLLAAVVERLDALLAALAPTPTPAPRKRAPRRTEEG